MCNSLWQNILYRRFDVSQLVLEQFFCVAESLGLQHMVRLEDTPVASRTSLLEMPCSPARQCSPSPRPTAQLASCSSSSLRDEAAADFLCSEGTPMSPHPSLSTAVPSTVSHQEAACSSTSSSSAASPAPRRTTASLALRRTAASPAPRQTAASPAPRQTAASPAPRQTAASPAPRQTAASESAQPTEPADDLALLSTRAQRQCPHCLDRIPGHNYARHLQNHANNALKKCDFCGKMVRRGDNMKRHKEGRCPRYKRLVSAA